MKRMLLNGVVVSALAIAAGGWLADWDQAQAAAAQRPVPMFDPFLGDEPADGDAPEAAGAIELLLFGDRQNPRAGYRKGEGAA